jgi:hypothetical protein
MHLIDPYLVCPGNLPGALRASLTIAVMKLPEDFKVSEGILELERRIGVPENFFRNLNDADDWTFIIKLHALFEAACTHLLLHHLKEPELASIISRLELSNKVTGKVAFLTKLKLISKDNRRFIATLSDLRNSLVHDVRNHEFSLPSMLTELTHDAVKNMAVAFSPYETLIREHPFDEGLQLGYQGDISKQAELSAVIERFKWDPRYHIWIGAHHVLIEIIDNYDYSDYLTWVRDRDAEG